MTAPLLKEAKMVLYSTLFCLQLSLIALVSGNLHSAGGSRMVQPEKGPKVSTRNLRQHRSVISEGNPIGAASTLKVLDFSADNDHERDSNGEWTIATLEAGFLPESFTICSTMTVDAWTTELAAAVMFMMYYDDEQTWGRVHMYAASSYTQFSIKLGQLEIIETIPTVFFPLQWTRVCLSLDSIASKVRLVVDG